jgi:hypothetical protein
MPPLVEISAILGCCQAAKHILITCCQTQPFDQFHPDLQLSQLWPVIFSLGHCLLSFFCSLYPAFASFLLFSLHTSMEVIPGTSTIPQTRGDDDGDPDHEKLLQTEPKKEHCLGGLVPLHRLCDRCRRMIDISGVDELLEHDDFYKMDPYHKFQNFELCTVGELIVSREHCRLCEKISSRIRGFHDLRSSGIVTCSFTKIAYGVFGGSSLAMNIRVREVRSFFAKLYVRSIDCKLLPFWSERGTNVLVRHDKVFDQPYRAQ